MQVAKIKAGNGGTINDAQWEVHRETIRYFYVSQGLSLKAIRQYLLEHHSFSASEQQYKRKFAEWKYSKNLKGSVYRAIGSGLERRGLTSDTAHATYGGVVLSPAQLKRGLRRHCVPSLKRKWKVEQRATTPDAVEIQSAEPHAAPRFSLDRFSSSPTARQDNLSEPKENIQVEVGSGDVVSNFNSSDTVTGSTQNQSLVGFQSEAPQQTVQEFDQPWTIYPDLLDMLPVVADDVAPPHQGESSLFPLNAPPQMTNATQIATTVHRSQLDMDVSECEILVQYGASLNLPMYQRPDCSMHTIDYLFLSCDPPEEDVHFILQTCCFLDALHLAIRWRKIAMLKALLIAGIGPSTLPKSSPWVLAVWKGYSEAFKILAAHSTLKDMEIDIPFSPFDDLPRGQCDFMHLASMRGHCHLIPTLVEAGFDVNGGALGPRGRTALQFAVERKDKEMARCLLENGANINAAAADDSGVTALQAAALKEDEDMVRLLLRYGADVNGKPALRNGYTALSAAIEARNASIFAFLLRKGADVNLIEWDGCDQHSIHVLVAARNDGASFLHRLTDAGLQLDTPLTTGGTLTDLILSQAAESQSLSVIKRLSDHSIDLPIHVLKTLLATFKVERTTHPYYIQPLFDSGVDIDHQTTHGTMLMRACQAGNWDMAKFLVEEGAQIDLPSTLILDVGETHIRTPLQAACESGNDEIVKWLLDIGAKINISAPSNYGYTALQIASARGDVTIVRMLLKRGAEVNAPGALNGGMTALQAAVWFHHLEIARMLLEAGADVAVSRSTANQYTSINLAARGGHLEMLKLLLQFHNPQKDGFLSVVYATASIHAQSAGHSHVVEFLGSLVADQRFKEAAELSSASAALDHAHILSPLEKLNTMSRHKLTR